MSTDGVSGRFDHAATFAANPPATPVPHKTGGDLPAGNKHSIERIPPPAAHGTRSNLLRLWDATKSLAQANNINRDGVADTPSAPQDTADVQKPARDPTRLSKIADVANTTSDVLSVGGKGLQVASALGISSIALAEVGVAGMVVGEAVNVAATVAGAVGTAAQAADEWMAGDSAAAKKTLATGVANAGITML
jgi:hypothetical protein